MSFDSEDSVSDIVEHSEEESASSVTRGMKGTKVLRALSPEESINKMSSVLTQISGDMKLVMDQQQGLQVG